MKKLTEEQVKKIREQQAKKQEDPTYKKLGEVKLEEGFPLTHVDGLGTVWGKEAGNKLSDEEKAARAKERATKKAKVKAARSAARQRMFDAKTRARKEPNMENCKVYEEAKKAYEEEMGRA